MQQIEELVRQGVSRAEIGRLTGFDPKTIRKYLQQGAAAPRYSPRQPRTSKLDGFKPYIEERLRAGVWNAVMLLGELRQRGYSGGYTILKDYLQLLREAARSVAVRRFETPAGKQAQLDWGYLGEIDENGRRRKLWAFVFTLGHSRVMMAAVATDQKLPTLLRPARKGLSAGRRRARGDPLRPSRSSLARSADLSQPKNIDRKRSCRLPIATARPLDVSITVLSSMSRFWPCGGV